jgi:acyl-CoA reductase-like NAD-dependent aldehyde dehydrogenase
MGYATTNPFTNKEVARFSELSDDALERLVKQAQSTFESWSTTSFDERKKVTKRAAAMPPMSSQSAADTLDAQVKLAVEHGATAIRLGPAPPQSGAFVQQTILVNVTKDNPIYEQELFDPSPCSSVRRMRTTPCASRTTRGSGSAARSSRRTLPAVPKWRSGSTPE